MFGSDQSQSQDLNLFEQMRNDIDKAFKTKKGNIKFKFFL